MMIKLANLIAAGFVAAVLTVDGLVVTSALLIMLALGGLIETVWSSSYLWLGLIAIALLAAGAAVAFIAVPLIVDFPDDD